MSYFSQSDLSALVPESWLTEGLDDSGDGTQDAFSKVQTLAEARINGTLSARFTTPLDTTGNDGLAAFLLDLGCHLAAAIVFKRRGIAAAEFPFADDLKRLLDRLDRIAAGLEPLSPVIPRAADSAEIISEDSRAWSKSLAS
jgi:phage gp36-like protein